MGFTLDVSSRENGRTERHPPGDVRPPRGRPVFHGLRPQGRAAAEGSLHPLEMGRRDRITTVSGSATCRPACNANCAAPATAARWSIPIGTRTNSSCPSRGPTAAAAAAKWGKAATSCAIHAYCGQRKLEAGRPIAFEFALLPTPVKPLDTATHFRERYYHNHDGVEAAARAGGNIINIHHANEFNPFINYPFLANDRLRRIGQGGPRPRHEAQNLLHDARVDEPRGRIVGAAEPGPRGAGARRRRRLSLAPRASRERLPARLVRPLAELRPLAQSPLRRPIEGGDVSAALTMTPISRWCNYYVEGLRWLLENIEIDGLYLDDVSYDRETLKRVRKVMARRPGCLIDLHSTTVSRISRPISTWSSSPTSTGCGSARRSTTTSRPTTG